MIPLSLRTRLTFWYSFLLAAALAAFALISFLEMRRTLLDSIDGELRNDLGETRRAVAGTPPSLIQARFARHDRDLFQITAADGSLVFQTGAARAARPPTPRLDASFETVRAGGVAYRGASTTFAIGSQRYGLRYWLPLRQYEQAVHGFGVVVLFSIPIVLLVGAAGGAWMSGRALRPVDRIIRDARAITARNLDRRLEVPRSRDELHELSQTLNDMFDRLEQAFRRVTDFTADASHELRTPVALMRTSAEVALRNPRTVEEYQLVLSNIHGELCSMSQLIDDLLVLARSDAETNSLEMSILDVGDPLRDAVARARSLAAAKQIRFRADLPGEPVPVDGNGPALARLFSALIENAIHYTSPGGEVVVVLTATGTAASIFVTDNGVGISAADLPHIFERFYRADKSRARQSGGTGLGLPIAQRIAQLHRGTITASSGGNGSEFVVVLPAT